MWDITSYDWKHKVDLDTIISNILNNMKDGSIILLHELEQTVSILPALIDQIREKGFEFELI